MKVSSRTWRVVAATGLVVGAVAVSSSVPQADTASAVTFQEDAGVLRLRLSNSGGSTITYEGPLALPGQPRSQMLRLEGKCELTPTSTPLLTLTTDPVPNFGAGLVSNGVGVRTKNNCSTDSGRITGAQSVTLELGDAFPDAVKIVGAEIDIEGKGNAELGYGFDGGPAVNRYDIVSATDNGPDSGINDNTRVVIPEDEIDVVFESIRLAPFNGVGQISLEGGGDGTLAQYLAAGKLGPLGTSRQTADTIFQLATVQSFDTEVPCNAVNFPAVIGGDAATVATITRLPDDGPAPCEPLPVTFEILDEGVLLRKPDVEGVNLRVTIVWSPVSPTESERLERTISLSPDDPTTFVPVEWCAGIATTADPTDPVVYEHPDDQTPWCLVSDDRELTSQGIVQTQVYDGAGDPMWK